MSPTLSSQGQKSTTRIRRQSRVWGGVTAALVGGTADHVSRHARVPTLLVRNPPATPIKRILVPLDGSALSEEAIHLATIIGRHVGAANLLVQVIDPSTSIATVHELGVAAKTHLREQEARIGNVDGIGYDGLVRRSDTIAECLLGLARPEDLFILASRRQARYAHFLLGSVTASIVRTAPVPEVLVPGVSVHLISALYAAAHGTDQPGPQ